MLCLTFSPDGRLLAGAEDTTTNRESAFGTSMKAACCASSTDTTALRSHWRFLRMANCWPPAIRTTLRGFGKSLPETSKPRSRDTLRRVPGVAFSPDGKTLATGSFDRKVKLWNIATQQEVATLEPLPGSCLSLRFSPDGRTLAAGSYLGPEPYMSLWQVPSFEEIAAAEATLKTGSKQP